MRPGGISFGLRIIVTQIPKEAGRFAVNRLPALVQPSPPDLIDTPNSLFPHQGGWIDSESALRRDPGGDQPKERHRYNHTG